jgi:hypothetical protein
MTSRNRQSIHLEWTQGAHQIGTATEAPAVLQHPNDPALLTARPDISAKPSGVEPNDRWESGKRARQRGKNNFRRSVNEGSRRAPSASLYRRQQHPSTEGILGLVAVSDTRGRLLRWNARSRRGHAETARVAFEAGSSRSDAVTASYFSTGNAMTQRCGGVNRPETIPVPASRPSPTPARDAPHVDLQPPARYRGQQMR